MKKVLMLVVLVTIFTGCTNTQLTIDEYIAERNKAIEIVKRTKCKKDCNIECNEVSNLVDRLDCRVNCIEVCK